MMTVEQFVQMNTAETEEYELVEGALIPLSSPTPLHSKTVRRVERQVENYFDRNPVGDLFHEIDCRISDDTVRRPDVSVFLGVHLQQIDLNKIPVPFAPDIAVEVLSASEKAVDVHRKVREYLGAGSKEVWLLDYANGELFVHTKAGIRLLQGTEVLESPLLPGFAAAVSEFFAGS